MRSWQRQLQSQLLTQAARLERSSEGPLWCAWLARHHDQPIDRYLRMPRSMVEREVARVTVAAAEADARRRFKAREDAPEGDDAYAVAVRTILDAMNEARRSAVLARQAEQLAVIKEQQRVGR